MSFEWAITGLGAISALGVGQGMAGITLSERAAPLSGGEGGALYTHFRPEDHLDPNVTRRMDPLSSRALICARWALADASLGEGARFSPDPRTGVAVGTSFGCQTTSLRYARRLCEPGGGFANPIDFPDAIDGAPASHVAVECALGGPSITVPDGELAGEMALTSAIFALSHGRAERMVVVAGDELTGAELELWEKLGLPGLPAPGGAGVGGILPSESMAALVVESRVAAERRRARIYACVLGMGVSVEPEARRPDYAQRAATHLGAVDQALARAKLGRGDVAAFSAALLGMPALERPELEAAASLGSASPALELVGLRKWLGYCPSDGVLRVAMGAAGLGGARPRGVTVHQGAARGGQCVSLILGSA